MARSDLGSSIVLILFGAAVAFESWRMPRYESIGGSIYSAPGLVPGLLGSVIALLGAIMLIRYLTHRGTPAVEPTVTEAAETPGVADDQAAYIAAPTSAAPTSAAPTSAAPTSAAPTGPAATGAAEIGAADRGRAAEAEAAPAATQEAAPSNSRMLMTLILSVIFAGGLVGRVPFWLAVFLFVFVSIMIYERAALKDARVAAIRVAIAGVIAATSAFAVPFVFEQIFLVNLP